MKHAERVADQDFNILCAKAASLSSEIEAARQLPAEFARELAQHGMFSMFVPSEIDGLALTPPEGMARLEHLARHDAASAWVCMIGSTAAIGSAFMAPDVSKHIFSAENRITCGIFAPNGSGYRDGYAYVVSGRWAWASGSANADYIGLGCWLRENREDDPKTAEMRLVMVPRALIEFHDTWHTMGLRGTSSGDVELKQARIPVTHSYAIGSDLPWSSSPTYKMPYFAFLAAGVGAVALGNARAAIDDFADIVGVKKASGERRLLAEKSRVQSQLAQAEAQLRSARLLYWDGLEQVWADVQNGADITPEKRAEMRLVSTYAVRQSVEVVRAIHDLAGGTSVYMSSSIQRRLRDAETMTQHMISSASTYELVGRVMLGGYKPDMML
ncbi:acyl-CoA dehydrogenase family protein [Alphaproteobacteria bacterium]|nr:acyl-CoA dehydrogenase family protein [Alphaproteobacteria bacterium]MDC0148476.1 acyl-CoA dehydrogenase family protein [Alphaproteobacteria bacterium]